MCSGPGADTALFRHLMAVLGMPAGAAAVPWGSRSEHTARGLQAAPSGESRQAGRSCGLALATAGKTLDSFPARSTWAGYGITCALLKSSPVLEVLVLLVWEVLVFTCSAFWWFMILCTGGMRIFGQSW